MVQNAFAELPPGCVPACSACERPRSVEESLAGKKARAIRTLSRWEAGVEDVVSPPEGRRLGYRDRAALKALWTPEEGWRFGMEGVRTSVRGPLRFARPRPFVPLTDCPVHTERVRKAMSLLASALPPEHRIAYAKPPRTGLEPPVAELLISHQLRRAVYLSCSPGTLARDLAILEKAFSVERIVPYDFFPRTAAVEALALLWGK